MLQSISRQQLITAAMVLIICLTVLQDFLEAGYHHFSFYLSESVLFKTYWLLFIPVCILLRKIFGSMKDRSVFLTLPLFVLTAVPLHLLLYGWSVTGLSFLLLDHTYTVTDTVAYAIAADLYKYLFVYSIIGVVFFRKQAPQETAVPQVQAPLPVDNLCINTGKNNMVIATDSILLITAATPYITIHTADKKQLHTATLKSIMDKLDGHRFVRIHKSAIVNVSAVVSYTSRLNGDYDLRLTNGQEVRLSRNYVSGFRQHLDMRSSS
ncbi:LytTR family DNA-binding domain-containing protein [Chitinophaga solisilvae]|uniref:LytTR family DNA-binding domain-containing protein n=1 Tax=Chitinophaga solisilvae TaxID=1233460 RepID=UPI00136A38D1|nr:LytTR family DNA-binding domain-containing protein [Chitinophaga solisilvae]